MLRNRVPHGATERLEPDAGKLARPVLRGGIAGNSDPLPDAKQWQKVATAMQHENDRLIVEGFATFDPSLEGNRGLCHECHHQGASAAEAVRLTQFSHTEDLITLLLIFP